jgi:hypothetical protein
MAAVAVGSTGGGGGTEVEQGGVSVLALHLLFRTIVIVWGLGRVLEMNNHPVLILNNTPTTDL